MGKKQRQGLGRRVIAQEDNLEQVKLFGTIKEGAT